MISFANWGNDLYSGKRSYDIVGKGMVWIGTGLVAIALSVIFVIYPGINPGLEFRGGTEFTISNPTSTAQGPAIEVLKKSGHQAGSKVARLGSKDLRIQADDMSSDQTQEVAASLAKAYKVDQSQVTSTLIGPTWGADVTKKAILSLVVFLALVAVVMALYFWTWTMSLSAIVPLIHDVTITVGVFAITRVEVTPATVIGLLTILGYSLYDTVVVFDKIRELTKDFMMQRKYTYGELVNLAVNQTMVRSINTSVTAILPVGAILFVGSFLLGAGTLRDISMALFVGMIVGTLSSIFLASPLLVKLRLLDRNVREHSNRVLRRREREAKTADKTDKESASEVKVIVSETGVGAHLGREAQPTRKPRSRR